MTVADVPPAFLVCSQYLSERFADVCQLKSAQHLVLLRPGEAGHDGEYPDRLYIHLKLALGGLFIGRSPESQIVLPHRGISRKHCCIISDGIHFGIQDNASTNGTYLNGERLSPEKARYLNSGDEIRLSNQESERWRFVFQSPGRRVMTGHFLGLEGRSSTLSAEKTIRVSPGKALGETTITEE